MKWFQYDTDFYSRPSIRAMRAKYGAHGLLLVNYVWCHVAARFQDGDASCRLYETPELINLDTDIPLDKIDAILNYGCTLEFEYIRGNHLYIFDRLAAPPHQIGSSLMFYKADNATKGAPWFKPLAEERRVWEHRNPLQSCYEVTSCNKQKNEQQNELPLSRGPEVEGVASGNIHDLMKAHVNREHTTYHPGCPTCEADRAKAVAG